MRKVRNCSIFFLEELVGTKTFDIFRFVEHTNTHTHTHTQTWLAFLRPVREVPRSDYCPENGCHE
jgi:hypothetical protein